MKLAAIGAIMVVMLSACSPEEEARDIAGGSWVGTITTEGNVTTVVNQSGSVWGGTATLVEEASIGVESGEDAYMFGRVAGIAVHRDRLYVLDSQVPTIRVYDLEGNYLLSMGREGQGPGEFERPNALEVGPEGHVLIRDRDQTRLVVLESEGAAADSLQVDKRLWGGGLIGSPDNRVFTGVLMGRGDTPFDLKLGVATLSLDGADPIYRDIPDSGWTRWTITTANPGGGSFSGPVPFAPTLVWTVLPSGAIAVGVSDTYQFEVLGEDGAKTVVQRSWNRVTVDPEEGEWHALSTVFQARANQPDWTWNGPEIPEYKPAYRSFNADRAGRIWVIREGPGTGMPNCDWPNTLDEYFDAEPCWTEAEIVDVFEEDGRFLGAVEVPEGFGWYPLPYITEDRVFAQVQDDAGTIMVKRYRLVPPGGAPFE